MRKMYLFIIMLSAAIISFSGNLLTQEGPSFEITLDKSVHTKAITGRVILRLSRTEEFSSRENGSPHFGHNIENFKPGKSAIIDAATFGYPINSIVGIPAGEYYVQVHINVYTKFNRSDGHEVWLPMDRGEGQSWQRKPGNLFNEPMKISFDPRSEEPIEISLDKIIPPIAPRMNTKQVKNIKIRSKLLSDFWGQDMELGARVLLPKDFDKNPDAHYPVHYVQGHFPRGNPGGFKEDLSNEFSKIWLSDDYPRFVMVTFEHPSPYYDDSYGVNSENMGPYGDAIVTELIPQVEEQFRGIGKSYGRVLSGGSTGGWIALAMQIFYPDFFGGTWGSYPDQVDFRKYQIVDILNEDNAYYIEHHWTKVFRPGARDANGNIRYMMHQENYLEEVLGTRYRSGGQWAAWNAVFAPVANDGYPKPIWHPITGKIDKDVAEWAKEHYDLRYILERDWATLGPKLVGKINVICGRMDNYYLNEAVYHLEDYLESTTEPYYGGSFRYGDKGGHGWSPWNRQQHYIELMKEMAGHIKKNAPEGTIF